MIKVKMVGIVGSFAEDKDKARDIRKKHIEPKIKKGEEITLDFGGVEAVTQSFVHALISELIRVHGAEVLDMILFKNCNETVRKIISIVVDYMQEAEY